MLRSIAAAAVASLALALPASAATVTLDPLVSNWVAVKPPSTAFVATRDGLTSTIEWGRPVGSRLRSGYVFAGSSGGDVTLGEEFDVGTFTHLNRVIRVGTSITEALLSVEITLNIDGTAYDFDRDFVFEHWETTNGARPCPFGTARVGVNRNGCADRVTIANNSGLENSITVGDLIYRLEITGFQVGGQLFEEFWTTERQDNSAVIRGRIVAEPSVNPPPPPPPPPPSPVPLPAGVWLLGAALAGLGLVRRRG